MGVIIYKTTLIIFTFLMNFSVFAKEPSAIDWKGHRYKVMKKYLKLHKKYSKQSCRGNDIKYKKLYKAFRGTGYFIPTIDDDELDRDAIFNNIDLLKNKLAWIKKNRVKLKKNINSHMKKISNVSKKPFVHP